MDMEPFSPPRKASGAPPTSPLKWTPGLKDAPPRLELPFGENLRRSFARSRSETNIGSVMTHAASWETLSDAEGATVWPQGHAWRDPTPRTHTYMLSQDSAQDTQMLMSDTRPRKRTNQDVQYDSASTLLDFDSQSSTSTLHSPPQTLSFISTPFNSEAQQALAQQALAQQAVNQLAVNQLAVNQLAANHIAVNQINMSSPEAQHCIDKQHQSLKRIRMDRPRSNSLPNVTQTPPVPPPSNTQLM